MLPSFNLSLPGTVALIVIVHEVIGPKRQHCHETVTILDIILNNTVELVVGWAESNLKHNFGYSLEAPDTKDERMFPLMAACM